MVTAEHETRAQGDVDVRVRFGVLGLYAGILIGIALISALRSRREQHQEIWALQGRVRALEWRVPTYKAWVDFHDHQHREKRHLGDGAVHVHMVTAEHDSRHHGDVHPVTAGVAHVDA
ncbi:MAG TPA: hypothetical protein VFC09_09740 [Candidatus Dormibacteraeota bacterium]|nr:hypothetical protein [Candidatus Dormibacteraeota bacterium]